MGKNAFLLAGSIFLVLSLISFLLLAVLAPFTPYAFSSHKIPLRRIPTCGGGCGGPPDNIGDSEYYWLNVQDERPLYMTLHGSDTISVALATNIFANSPTPTPITSNYKIDSYQSSYQGDNCNRCTPQTQFGSGYTVFAFAQLSSTAFEIQMVGNAEQATNTPILYWDWNILANDVGTQVVNFLVELQWKKSGVIAQTAKILRQSFTIQVTQPLLTIDPISVGALISGVINAGIGAGLTIPFIWGKLEERNRRKKKSLKKTIKGKTTPGNGQAGLAHQNQSQPSKPPQSDMILPGAKETIEPNFCIHCGRPIRAGSRFCINCGSKIS